MTILYLNSEKTQQISYRPYKKGDVYSVKVDGETVSVESFSGFLLKELKPSPAVVSEKIMGKADEELSAMGIVYADDKGNEIVQTNESDGGEVKDPKLVVKALQKLINKAGRA